MKYIPENKFYVVDAEDKDFIESLFTSLGFRLDLRMNSFGILYYDIYYQNKIVSPSDIIDIVNTIMCKLNRVESD